MEGMTLVHQEAYMNALDVYAEVQHDDIAEDLYVDFDEIVRPSLITLSHNDDVLACVKITEDLAYEDWPEDEYPDSAEFYIRDDIYAAALLTYH